jgi:DNA-binding MarR family transcriptional regulator
MEVFRDEDLPRSLTGLTLFLYVCENEGLTVSELAHVSRSGVAMTARVAKMLAGEVADAPVPPDRMIFEFRHAPEDKRLKFVHLTPRGRALRDRIEDIIAEAHPIGARRALGA